MGTEMTNFSLFSANGKRKTEVCFPSNQQMINGNPRLLCRQTCHLWQLPAISKKIIYRNHGKWFGRRRERLDKKEVPEPNSIFSRSSASLSFSSTVDRCFKI
jgi:hypothetical protein